MRGQRLLIKYPDRALEGLNAARKGEAGLVTAGGLKPFADNTAAFVIGKGKVSSAAIPGSAIGSAAPHSAHKGTLILRKSTATGAPSSATTKK